MTGDLVAVGEAIFDRGWSLANEPKRTTTWAKARKQAFPVQDGMPWNIEVKKAPHRAQPEFSSSATMQISLSVST